jgi:Fis family transcriptional regulator
MTTQATQGKSGESRVVVSGEEASEEPLRASVRAALKRYFKDLNGHRPAGLYQMVLNEVEQPLLETVMSYTRGNQSQAAVILGINRNTLRKKLKQHGLD